MTKFKVKAATEEGRVISREVEARSREELSVMLEKEGLLPIKVKKEGRPFSKAFFKGRKRSVKRGEFLIFNKGLAALLKAGLPVVECLETLKGQASNEYFEGILDGTANYIRNGESLSDAFAHHGEVFSSLYTASISAGERTGDLIPAISGYINYQQRIEAIRKKVVSSVTYPAILTAASLAVIAFLIVYVVPTFSKIYISTGATLPLASRILIAASSFMRRYILLFAGFFLGAGFAIRAYIKSEGGRYALDRAKLEFPQLGGIYLSYTAAKFSRTLSMVLKSGVHLVHALEMSRGVINNTLLEGRLDYVIKKAREGETITGAMAEAGFMPEITLRMLGVGERSASLPEMLADIASFHDEEVDHKVGIITDLIEPALMIIMGLIIGAIVVLLYLPIFQLGANI
ncbi:MAG: type II secretion system F family protein [Deltaproteobacteria bacterium]|nr:type II secretion system F family protein [Deltaproteobacteria bacterium]